MSKNWIQISKDSFHLSYSLVLSQTLWNLGVAEPPCDFNAPGIFAS